MCFVGSLVFVPRPFEEFWRWILSRIFLVHVDYLPCLSFFAVGLAFIADIGFEACETFVVPAMVVVLKFFSVEHLGDVLLPNLHLKDFWIPSSCSIIQPIRFPVDFGIAEEVT